MKHRWLGVAALVIVGVFGAPTVNSQVSGQQPACLHGQNESAQEMQRRREALALTREINTLESRARLQRGTYLPLQQLPLTVSTPQGFAMRLSTDGTGYAFSVKDTVDACRFGYFSDQDGLIFVGQPLQ